MASALCLSTSLQRYKILIINARGAAKIPPPPLPPSPASGGRGDRGVCLFSCGCAKMSHMCAIGTSFAVS